MAVISPFQELFEAPSISGMLALDSRGFELFVGYVFERAGYGVEDTANQRGHGLDLKLYTNGAVRGKLVAGVSAKRYDPNSPAPNRVGVEDIHNLAGAIVPLGKVTGYLITTSEFTQPATDAAARNPNICLIDVHRLMRYITYVRGSRHAGDDSLLILPEYLFQADAIKRRPPTETKILALANNKGGVGKTTSVLNLGFALAEQGKRVLLVDMDAQANLTQSLSKGRMVVSPHLADYFSPDRHDPPYTLADLVRQTDFKNVWLIPSHSDLRLVNPKREDWTKMELKFAADLHDDDLYRPRGHNPGSFDWIIIDTPPAMSLYTRLALIAAHYISAPVIPSAYAESGIFNLFDTLEAASSLINTDCRTTFLGCFATHWQDNTTKRETFNAFTDSVRFRGYHILNTKIPLDNAIDRAHQEEMSHSKTIFNIGRRSNVGGVAYRDLLDELLIHCS